MFGKIRKTRQNILSQEGNNPLQSSSFYNGKCRLQEIKRYHEMMKAEKDLKQLVDEITWNDLEMDEIYLRVNHTYSFIGEQVLYHKMHCMDQVSQKKQRETFEKRLDFWEQNEAKRLAVAEKLCSIGKNKYAYYLPEFLLHTDTWKIGNPVLLRALQVLFAVLTVTTVFYFQSYLLIALCATGFINLSIYTHLKMVYEAYLFALGDFRGIYHMVRWMKKHEEVYGECPDEVSEGLESLKGLSRGIACFHSRKQAAMTGDVFALFKDYILGVLLIDVISFNHLMKKMQDKQEAVMLLLQYVGEIDTELSVLSFRKSMDTWCVPTFVDKGMQMSGVVHPLLEHPVANDFALESYAIVTGANASGKSTFMKAVAINVILAQTIQTCTAQYFQMKKTAVMTCMALRDDVISGESYYFREVKYVKRILEQMDAGVEILCVIDEILKGTNTAERIAASRAILSYMSQKKCMVLIATHDMELTELEHYEKFYFESRIAQKDVVFDYQIHKGISKSSNAIALLDMLAYPEAIVAEARENLA